MSFFGQSQNNGVSRQASGRSSRRTSLEDVQASSTGISSAPSRPITRGFLKSQQMQTSTSSQPAINSSLTSLSSLSSSNSSLNSMDTVQFENKLNSFQSNEADTLSNILNQESSFIDKFKPIDLLKKNDVHSYQKILVDETPVNIVQLIERTRINGRSRRNLINLPNSTLGFLTQRLEMHDYPLLIKRLDQSSVIQNLRNGSSELDDLVLVLRVMSYQNFIVIPCNRLFKKDIENRLINFNANANNPDNMAEDDNISREEFEVETINIDSANVFRQLGGIEILKRILLMSILTCEQQSENQRFEKYVQKNETSKIGFEKCFILKIKCKCIHILNRLICLPHFGKQTVQDLLMYDPSVKKNQSSNPDYDTSLLQYLFSLIMFKEPRLQACQLIESILLHIPMLNLNSVQNLELILGCIDDEGLSCICKIFAVTLSNLDTSDKKYLATGRRLVQQNNAQTNSNQVIQVVQSPQKSDPVSNSSIRDQNLDFLLNVPTLLFRLVNLVRRKDYTVRFPGANNEIEHWIRYIDETLSDSDDNDSMDTSLSHLDNHLNQPALLATAKLNNFVYVLYTLSLLLIGKEKKRVQKSLTKLRLASALNSLFDHLIWNCRCEYPNGGNGQDAPLRSHICPEVAVKIQFLRLVHSFCDHSDFKRVTLTKDETDEILNYNRDAPSCLKINESILKMDNRVRCSKSSEGLLSKIVNVIKKEPFSASFRFWLIRAIESFLRGGTSYAEQIFLINRGVVEDTIQNILAVNFTRPKEVIQSCFDMLGELVKFNARAFEIINNQLLENENFNLLITMINQSLIDSNMFLRSIFLSIDFIEQNVEVLNFKISSNKVLSYFDLFERRILFLSRMMGIISVLNLSQENISCLNTTLIVLMIAHKRQLLPKYLKALKSKSLESMLSSDFIHVNSDSTINSNPGATNTPNQSGDFMLNFKDLLLFWQSHYLQKDKDCAGLEQNSRIEFSFWKKIVELLLDPNPKNECSLYFYLNNDYLNMNTNRKNRIDDYRSD